MCTVEFIFVAIRGSDVCRTLSLENDKVREKWGMGGTGYVIALWA